VRLLPDADDQTLVASIRFGRRQVHVAGLAGYYRAVAARRTNRLPFHDRSIPHAALASMGEAARAENALLRIYDDPDEVARIVELLHEADRAEAHDPAVRVERQAWIGGPQRADGIPVRSLGPRPSAPTAPFRDLGRGVDVSRESARFEQAPTVAILSTRHDERLDWVRAGQALQRVLLAATWKGLATTPISQPVEVPAIRRLLIDPRSDLSAQMVLRIGYGKATGRTPRRPLSEVLPPHPPGS